VLPYFVGVWETGNPVGAAETGMAVLGLTDTIGIPVGVAETGAEVGALEPVGQYLSP